MEKTGMNDVNLAYIDFNDTVNGCDEGICISIWFQGCPHHCKGCHNPETWDFNKAFLVNYDELFYNIQENQNEYGISKNLSILGGEPLCPQNIENTLRLITDFSNKYKTSKIFLWTGYSMKEIKTMPKKVLKTLKSVNLLITDRFEIDKLNLKLKYRGSSNQNVWKSKKILFWKKLCNITSKLEMID